MRSLDVVAEREERVGPEGNSLHGVEPCALLLACEYRRLYLEELLPLALCKHIHIILTDIKINSVVAVCTSDTIHELKSKDLRGLTQVPVVSLCSGKACAVDSGLLTGADSDSLTAACVCNGVGLGVLQRDERDRQVVLCALGEILGFRRDIREQLVIDNKLVATLLEGDSVDLLALDLRRNVVRVDLDYVVVALLLALEDLEGFRLVSGSDNAVGYLAVDYSRGGNVAYVGQRDEIAVAAHSVSAPCPCVGAGERGELTEVVHPVDLREGVGQGKSDSGTGRGNVLEACCSRVAGRSLKFLDELPAVECVQEVDVAGTSVQYLDGKLRAVLHVDPGRLLVGVAAVL